MDSTLRCIHFLILTQINEVTSDLIENVLTDGSSRKVHYVRGCVRHKQKNDKGEGPGDASDKGTDLVRRGSKGTPGEEYRKST